VSSDAKPQHRKALVAVDLGAESCRVSLLHWVDGAPRITLVHRFPNAPKTTGDEGSLHWDMGAIWTGVCLGLEKAAALAPEGIQAIAVDGWGVDYVRLGEDGVALSDPFCYRDLRTVAAEQYLHRHLSPERMREITAITPMRINTLYQLHADRLTKPAGGAWMAAAAGVHPVPAGRAAGLGADAGGAYAAGGCGPGDVVAGDFFRRPIWRFRRLRSWLSRGRMSGR